MPLAEVALGHPIEVISGEEEGRLIYLGVSHTLAIPTERRLLLILAVGRRKSFWDVGHEIAKVESFGMGTVKHSSVYFPDGKISAAGFDAAVLSVRSILEDATPAFQPEFWRNAYGSSGTVRAISDALLKNGFGDAEVSLPKLFGFA